MRAMTTTTTTMGREYPDRPAPRGLRVRRGRKVPQAPSDPRGRPARQVLPEQPVRLASQVPLDPPARKVPPVLRGRRYHA
jgi:hypothetical protein